MNNNLELFKSLYVISLIFIIIKFLLWITKLQKYPSHTRKIKEWHAQDSPSYVLYIPNIQTIWRSRNGLGNWSNSSNNFFSSTQSSVRLDQCQSFAITYTLENTTYIYTILTYKNLANYIYIWPGLCRREPNCVFIL